MSNLVANKYCILCNARFRNSDKIMVLRRGKLANGTFQVNFARGHDTYAMHVRCFDRKFRIHTHKFMLEVKNDS